MSDAPDGALSSTTVKDMRRKTGVSTKKARPVEDEPSFVFFVICLRVLRILRVLRAQKSNCPPIFQKRGWRMAVGTCHTLAVACGMKALFSVSTVFEFVAL